MRKTCVAVIGGNKCNAKEARLAEEVGVLIAKQGAVLINGGLGGIMEAASRGAKKAGGLVVGCCLQQMLIPQIFM